MAKAGVFLTIASLEGLLLLSHEAVGFARSKRFMNKARAASDACGAVGRGGLCREILGLTRATQQAT
jgi:hypothetical protein